MTAEELKELEQKLVNLEYWGMDMYLGTMQITDKELIPIIKCIRDYRHLKFGDHTEIKINKNWDEYKCTR
jgi:hypothetical protein